MRISIVEEAAFMLAKIYSCALTGLCGELVEVRVDLSNEAASFNIKGLSGSTLANTEERIRLAIQNSGYLFPSRGITIHLFPTHLLQENTVFDLPIALGVLLASGQIHFKKHLDECIFLGELSPDGSLRHINGVLPLVSSTLEKQVYSVYVPALDALEASLVPGNIIYPIEKLSQLLAHLKGGQQIMPYIPDPPIYDYTDKVTYEYDMANVRGQEHVKRALEVAASGMHNILMSGPRGSGKMNLARCIPSILPQLTLNETLEIAKIYSVSGMLSPCMPLKVQRPFRVPHHSINDVKLIGDGCIPYPSEMSLAHHGVLFLHELTEYEQNMLEGLKQPLEDKVMSVSCIQSTITYPAHFMLVASMKPCPCGYLNHLVKECACSKREITHYQRRFSKLFQTQFDIHVEVPLIDYGKLADKRQVENSETIRRRVQSAREMQLERFKGTKLTYNSEMGPKEVREFCRSDGEGERLMKAAIQQLHLSTMTGQSALRLARTIADMAGSELVLANHIAEAIHYRLRVGV
jgi:magnesium chelatase family protein